MENKTPFDIIPSTENAPFILNQLSEQFFAVEENFNSVVSKLNIEKTEIETNSAKLLTSIQSQNEGRISTEKYDSDIDKSVGSVVEEAINNWKFYKKAADFCSFFSMFILPVLWWTSSLPLWVSTAIGGVGIFLSNYEYKRNQKKIKRAREIVSKDNSTAVGASESARVVSESARKELGDISVYLKRAINNEIDTFNTKIESLRKKLATEYNAVESKELSDKSQKLNAHQSKTQSVMAELREKTISNIQDITRTVNDFVCLLNQLPESFDSNSLDWRREDIFKSKESVATNFRVGIDTLHINIEGTNYSVEVPRCFPFLNKSNIAFSCSTQTDTKEAVRISHNIIARTLIALPASKTKITFIDPLKLGGNAAPFTPLLREIYGGMVFTQQNDIENQLALLTRAIENVIQKYLQDKFEDIADYNFKTKEVPEPYRLLVVYNFPHGFNDTTAKKLLNIIQSGPKAGVHTILVIDKNGKLPYGMGWNIFDSINIHEISLSNSQILDSMNEVGVDQHLGIVTVQEPSIGDIYEGVVTRITDFGLFVEFLPDKEGLVHISQVSCEHVDTLDGIFKVGDKVKVKLLEIDRQGRCRLSIKEVPLINAEPQKAFEFDKNLPYSEIVDYINNELPNVSSIKVPFTKYIAPQNEWWQEKAHKSFSVPIGRHALEVQHLKFDNDDDNQALLIGKPGSGKSNLLHVIIANSIWKYSPDQLEIHLIDFKGGVEFTVYADKKIPHIRTIAIESEREFGLSVLDGVEKELLRREEEFSKTGVQNIEQYHDKFPNERMARVMLIVDEFQEFYAEDDNIKQAVDDKFDRIVRKGRAFGINTLFSSQTLSGNSIKKSTKELIDIRIALMCSDLDSNQILDDRNPAARDLTRPGEGIYNPDNGKVEGNRIFQAFFIDRNDLIKTIESVVEFANANGNGNKNFKQIIFRGSEKALMEKDNHPLLKITPSANPKSLRLWVGEPVAIADDVTAVMRKQGGSNLLVAGYDESIGLRIMCSSIISIAVQQQPNTCKFYAFNFYNVDSEFVNVSDELFNSIKINIKIKQDCVAVNRRQVKESLQLIKDEIEKRLSGSSTDSQNIYLTFFSLQRGRAFRKDGYSMSDEGDLLAYILKEGADVGVYSLVQVDTMDNFSKNLDDNLLKEFSQRVASQMNPDNSVKVIGNQKAAKLGNNRALYYDDNENTMIKFKPYELPAFTWVAQLQKPQSSLS